MTRTNRQVSHGAGVGPANPDGPAATSVAHCCPVDGASCHLLGLLTPGIHRELVAVAIHGGLEGDELASAVQEQSDAAMTCVQHFLPCGYCRRGEQALAKLPGTRLGWLQRQALLRAATSDGDFAVVRAEAEGRAAREALRRAVAALLQLGLVEATFVDARDPAASEGSVIGPGRRWCRAIRRTPAGQVLVEVLGDSLRGGERVRWSQHLDALRSRLHAEPHQMLLKLHRNLEDAHKSWAETARSVESLHRRFEELLQDVPSRVRTLLGVESLVSTDRLNSRGRVDTLAVCIAAVDRVLAQMPAGDGEVAAGRRGDESAGSPLVDDACSGEQCVRPASSIALGTTASNA